ncbi:MAG: ABC transporter ATP-binding protein [Acidobacteria bacterium]|nr:ABC transporter ATP-binding protein [Acidobacteriota bacterium]MBI3657528.1 ABC transporter ATP-binding protein [Acidobacteriota bacterium]
MITLERVSKQYGESKTVLALRHIDLTLRRGERVAVMGPSGSGKTTLLNVICGLDEPSEGRILFEGLDLSALDDDARTRLRRDKIGMVFQTFNLMPTLSTLENIALPRRLQGQSRRESEHQARAMSERVGLSHRLDHRPDELSGGERQRVAIARALIMNPPLLLADEPTGNLDSATGHEILELLHALHIEFNMTILMVTHNIQAAESCRRIVTLRDGQIVRDAVTATAGEAH